MLPILWIPAWAVEAPPSAPQAAVCTTPVQDHRAASASETRSVPPQEEEERTVDFTSGVQKVPEHCVCLPFLEKTCLLLGLPTNLPSSSVLGTESLLPNSLPCGMRETPSVAMLLPGLSSLSPLPSAGPRSFSTLLAGSY